MSTLYQGYTYQPSADQRIANLVGQLSPERVMAAATMSGGHVHNFERVLVGMVRAKLAEEQAERAWREEVEAQMADYIDQRNTYESVRPTLY